MARNSIQTGGYRFKCADDGPNRGVWTNREKAQEQQRRAAAQSAAASAAEANMAAAIAGITGDASLSTEQKRARLRLLRPSGYSDNEWKMIRDAEAAL